MGTLSNGIRICSTKTERPLKEIRPLYGNSSCPEGFKQCASRKYREENPLESDYKYRTCIESGKTALDCPITTIKIVKSSDLTGFDESDDYHKAVQLYDDLYILYGKGPVNLPLVDFRIADETAEECIDSSFLPESELLVSC